MKLRWLAAAVLAALILVGCAPDGESPGAGSPAVHPSGHEAPASEPADNPFDY